MTFSVMKAPPSVIWMGAPLIYPRGAGASCFKMSYHGLVGGYRVAGFLFCPDFRFMLRWCGVRLSRSLGRISRKTVRRFWRRMEPTAWLRFRMRRHRGGG